jgi:predicted patatin/cPLA2 family phospholipase
LHLSDRLLLALLLALLGGCAQPPAPAPVPEPHVTQAHIPGYRGIRYGYDQRETNFVADYQAAMRAAQPGPEGVALLALSGGGPNGAFCAGLLTGWTATGQRPEFQVVTGVSTGALAAPFAFLGPAYDARLAQAYTTISDPDIFQPHYWRSAFSFLQTDSLADTTPLAKTLSTLVDQPVLDSIAAEHRRGRRLYVCTTDLTSGRPVFWNLTAIAASGRPDALPLFRKILVASASIPIIFPPQYFEVEAGSDRYTEMHVDGGLSRQVFVHMNGARAGLAPRPDGSPTPLTTYIICNAKVMPDYNPIPPALPAIALRTVASLIRAQAIGDLHRIYGQTMTEGAAFRLATMPEDFNMEHQGTFESGYMQRVFNLGRERATRPDLWQEKPPLLDVQSVEAP